MISRSGIPHCNIYPIYTWWFDVPHSEFQVTCKISVFSCRKPTFIKFHPHAYKFCLLILIPANKLTSKPRQDNLSRKKVMQRNIPRLLFKNYHLMELTVDSLKLMFLQSSKSRDTETRTKMRPYQIYILCCSLRIHGQLPAPTVNGGEDTFWKWPDFQLWRTRDLELDLGSGHTAYRHASLIDLYIHAKFHWNGRNFVDGRTYTQTQNHVIQKLR